MTVSPTARSVEYGEFLEWWMKRDADERAALETAQAEQLRAAGLTNPEMAGMPEFPESGLLDAALDYVHDDMNVLRRSGQLEEYLQGLFGAEITMVAKDIVIDDLLEEYTPSLTPAHRSLLMAEVAEAVGTSSGPGGATLLADLAASEWADAEAIVTLVDGRIGLRNNCDIHAALVQPWDPHSTRQPGCFCMRWCADFGVPGGALRAPLPPELL